MDGILKDELASLDNPDTLDVFIVLANQIHNRSRINVMRGWRDSEWSPVFWVPLRKSILQVSHCLMLCLLVLYSVRVVNLALVLHHILQSSQCSWEAPYFPLWREGTGLMRNVVFTVTVWTLPCLLS